MNKHDGKKDWERYVQSCESGFWNEIFKLETGFLRERLQGAVDVLSIGCGPAAIEKSLSKLSFKMTGFDISIEALGMAPDGIRKICGTAEELPFEDASFDAVIFVVSLQFVRDFRRSLEEAARVLRRKGRMVVMMLNPESDFYKERISRDASYVARMRHSNIDEMEKAARRFFKVDAEFFLGVEDGRIFENQTDRAVLKVLNGIKI